MTCFLLATALFCYIDTPTAEMREQPLQTAEIVSQAYFSEPVTPLEEKDGWLKIATDIDHYQGWIKKENLHQRQNPFPSNSLASVAKVKRCSAHLYAVEDTVFGPIMTLPFESRLELLDPNVPPDSRWLKVGLHNGRQAFIQRGDVDLQNNTLTLGEMVALSKAFLGLPYTWGGRSSFGYDCSGFVQMLYRQMGVFLPRDSKDQMRWEGFNAITLEELNPGDLIFFGVAEDKIRHVGLYIGNGQFIHSTVAENAPYIHISDLSGPDWNGAGKWPYRAARTLRDKTT